MLIARRELCVCQIMGVLGISQPLVSRNLAMLSSAGLLKERKEGKLVFYSLSEKMSVRNRKVIDVIRELADDDATLRRDLGSLQDCEEFQKKAGKCDMKTFRDFIAKKAAHTAAAAGRTD